MPVLYRTYRPQRFAEIVGQEPIVKTLQNAVTLNKVAHAYLFCGSRGVGKTSAARILAKAVNCPNSQQGDPCATCPSCQAIANNSYLDLIEIDAASHTGVDNIRELIGHASFKPTQGRFKIIIIDEVHMLSKSAFNALLKTLEEPPAHVIFILATTDPQKIPATIISRSQRFDFKRISDSDIEKALTEISKKSELGISQEIISLVAHTAHGGMRDGLSLLEQVSSLGSEITLAEAEQLIGATSRQLSQKLFDLLISRQTPEIYGFFDELLERGTDFEVYNRDFLEFLREQLNEVIVKGENNSQLKLPLIIYLTRLFLRSYKELEVSPDPSLPMLLASLEAIEKMPQSEHNPNRQTGSIQPVISQKPVINSTDLKISQNLDQPVREFSSPLPETTVFWPAVIDQIKIQHGPLAMLLKETQVKVNNNQLILSVTYPFHQEQLKQSKNQQLIQQAVKKITDSDCRLVVLLQEPDSKTIALPKATLEAGLMVLGGEIVD